MFGFLVGGASLAGLVYTLRSRHCSYGYGGYGCGRGYGSHRWHGHHHGSARGGSRARRRFFLRRMFEKLDTTPGQEKAIGRAVDRVAEAGRDLRGELRESLAGLADALRGDELDEAALDALSADHDAALARFRATATDALKEVHEALDERQRAQVADFIESRRRGGGPYRTPPGKEEEA